MIMNEEIYLNTQIIIIFLIMNFQAWWAYSVQTTFVFID